MDYIALTLMSLHGFLALQVPPHQDLSQLTKDHGFSGPLLYILGATLTAIAALFGALIKLYAVNRSDLKERIAQTGMDAAALKETNTLLGDLLRQQERNNASIMANTDSNKEVERTLRDVVARLMQVESVCSRFGK